MWCVFVLFCQIVQNASKLDHFNLIPFLKSKTRSVGPLGNSKKNQLLTNRPIILFVVPVCHLAYHMVY